MKKYYCLLLCSFMCFVSIKGTAQTDTCVTHLKDASASYDQGSFDNAIVLLNRSIENCSLSKDEKLAAYKLLALCYISIDNLEAADRSVVHMMKLNPNYAPDKFKDDPRLSNLFKKFKPAPTFAIGISGGINNLYEKTVNQYSIAYPNGLAPESYKSNTGFQLGIQAERKVYKGLWAEIGFSFRSSSYDHTLFNVDSSDVNYSEKLTYLDFPVSLKYYFPIRHFRPYIQAGAYFTFLTSALSTTKRDDQRDIINRLAERNAYQTGYFGCAGIGYNLKSFLFFINARYIVYPDNVNKAGTRYADEVNVFKYYYIDNDFTLDNMQFNIGASFILAYKNIKVTGK